MLTRTELAAVCRFIACLLVGEDIPEPAAPGEASTPKRQGRPRKVQDAPATTEAPATQTTTAAPVETKSAEPAKEEKPKPSKTLEDLRAHIAPLVRAARGSEVQALLNKYAPEDYGACATKLYMLSLLAERPEVHEAFVQDIEMLKM